MTNLNDANNDAAEELVAPEENGEELIEELGALVFESALLQYMADVDEETLAKFEEYVDKNAGHENFLEELSKAYPEFEKLLLTEMAVLQNDMKEIVE